MQLQAQRLPACQLLPLGSLPAARSTCRHACRASAAQETRHALDDGVELQVLSRGQLSSTKPPLLFVHGAFQGAWCWEEHFLPFFERAGYQALAVSLRCHGTSGGPCATGCTLSTHVEDVQDLIRTLPQAPVLLGHSLGGLVVQRYLLELSRQPDQCPRLCAAILLASSPPDGSRSVLSRKAWPNPTRLVRLMWTFSFMMRSCDACQSLWFSADLPKEAMQRIHQKLKDTQPTEPLVYLSRLAQAVPLPQLPVEQSSVPVLVLGGESDAFLDPEGCRETAKWARTDQLVMVPGLAHDMMLDTRWERAASSILQWLEALPAG